MYRSKASTVSCFSSVAAQQIAKKCRKRKNTLAGMQQRKQTLFTTPTQMTAPVFLVFIAESLPKNLLK
jgi:hypothetical protein